MTRLSGIDFRNLASRGCPWQTASEEQGERPHEPHGTSHSDAQAARSCSSQLGAAGSGAASRTRLSTLAVAIAAFALLALVPLSQAKVVVNGYGSEDPGTGQDGSKPISGIGPNYFGGQFGGLGGLNKTPRGIAVNTSGNGAPAGTIYVAHGFSGNRVERFSPTGAFQRLWGQDVIAPSIDDMQRLVVNATGGTYTLTFNGFTTDPIAFDARPESGEPSIQAALGALPSINGTANVQVTSTSFTPGYFVIVLQGALAGTDQPQISVDSSQLVGSAKTSTIVDGHAVPGGASTGFEICTVASDCKAGSTSGTTDNGGQLNEAQGIAVNQSNGHVYVTEEASVAERGNHRISEFDADGNFVRAWGWDVVKTGGVGDVSNNAFEICTVAADCKQGESGANGGEFGGAVGYPVVDSSNNVWVPDPTNRRIQEFSSTGTFIAAYGYDVDALGGGGGLEKCTSTAPGACQAGTAGSGAGQFSNGPRRIAFDSSGNLYALDPGNNRVQKFDPGLTTATTFGASTFAAYTTLAPEELTSVQGGTGLVFSVRNNVTGGGEYQLLELDPSDASVKDTSLVGAGITEGGGESAINGLAADGAGDLYATTGSPQSPRPVLVLSSTPNPAPVLTINPVTVKTDTSADFSGTIDSKGGMVGNCKFQYSTDQLDWTDVAEPDCDSLASSGVQAVGEHVSDLIPNTHYFLRLQASRPFVPNSTVTSSVKAFDTDSVAPVISDLGAIQVADTSARLIGTIDPRNSTTGYIFEYGPTAALGFSTAPLDIGGGNTPITVSQIVGGLAKDTTYHFRLVATNATGTTTSASKTLHTRTEPFPPANPGNCPNEALRQAQGSTYLPDCRAYEMVSPPDKNVGGVAQGAGSLNATFAADANAAAFCTTAVFGEPPAQMPKACAVYVSRRGPSGWQTTSPFPPFCRNDRADGINDGAQDIFLSPNLDRAFLAQPETEACPFPRLDPAAPLPAKNIYREDLTTDPFSFDLLAPNQNDAPIPSTNSPIGGFEGASDDFSHIVFNSQGNQTPDSPPQGSFPKLYDWHNGSLSLISRDVNNVPFTTGSGVPVVENTSAVSSDGNRIFFDNPVEGAPPGVAFESGACAAPGAVAGCDIYMREDDATTYAVSEPECTASCGPTHSVDVFRWASPAGDIALFESCDKLTDDSTAFFETSSGECFNGSGLGGSVTGEQAKLYRWDRSLPDGHRLVDLTVDHEPADGTKPKFKGLIGASSDGNTVYFIARGQIVSGAPTGDAGLKLYRWRWNGGNPNADYLGPYVSTWDNGTTVNLAEQSVYVNDPNTDLRHVRVTSDGKYLMITSQVPYDPVADRDTDVDAYRWDEEDGWTCISCQSPGTPSAGNVNSAFLYAGRSLGLIPLNAYGRRDLSISADGKRVIFSTPDALVPADVNGETGCPVVNSENTSFVRIYRCQDIYEWNDGRISLLTTGTGSDPFILMGATASGNVFYETRQQLVGWDKDDGTDVYTTRIDGGFPEPPAQPASCEGESCRGEGTAPAVTTGAGTAVFQGQGNPAPKHKATPKHHKKRHHRRAHKRHQRAAKHNRRAGR